MSTSPPTSNNREQPTSRTHTALDPPVPHLAPYHPLPRIRSLVISRPCTARVVIGPPHQWQKRGYLRPSFQITLIISVACAVPGGGCAPLVPLVQPEEPLRLLASPSGGTSNAKCIMLHASSSATLPLASRGGVWPMESGAAGRRVSAEAKLNSLGAFSKMDPW